MKNSPAEIIRSVFVFAFAFVFVFVFAAMVLRCQRAKARGFSDVVQCSFHMNSNIIP